MTEITHQIAERGTPVPEAAPEGACCVACGYPLHGMALDARCPECAAPVRDSMRGDTLSVADPDYVRGLARGISVIFAGTLVSMAWWFAMPLLFVVGVELGLMAPRAALVLVQSVDLLGALLLLVGWWLATAPDPALPPEEARAGAAGRQDLRIRRALRAVLVVIAVISAIGFIGLFTPGLANTGLSGVFGNIVVNTNVGVPALLWVAIALRFLLLIARVARFFLGLAYFERLALRIPDRELSQAIRRQRWVFPLWMTAGWIIVIGPLIGAVHYLATLLRLRRAVARCAERSA